MLGRIVEGLARLMAILGGLVLTALVLMTCLSVAGRFMNGWLHSGILAGTGLSDAILALGVGPVNGDFELVEACMAFVIFAFMPLTQLRDGHASVDVFTNLLGDRANRTLIAVWAVVFALVLVLIAWQLGAGMLAKRSYGETTYLIQFPIWWAYAGALSGAIVAAFVAVYVAMVRVSELITGDTILVAEGADH